MSKYRVALSTTCVIVASPAFAAAAVVQTDFVGQNLFTDDVIVSRATPLERDNTQSGLDSFGSFATVGAVV